MQVVYLITQNHNSLLFSARKLLCDNKKKRPLGERKKCDLDSIYTKIKSAQAVTGIYYQQNFNMIA